MNEKQNRLLNYSDGYLPFSSEDSHNCNYGGKSANPLALQTPQGNDFGNTHELDNCNIVDGLSKYTKSVIRVSPTDDHHSAVFKHLMGVKDTDMLNDEHDQDLLNTPELEWAMINDYANHPVITSSEMIQEHRNIYTDEDVLDYEPELIVCYKEINYDVVKDICVDEGTILEDKGLTSLHFDDYSGPCANEYALDEEPGDLDIELLIHDALEASSEADDDVHNSKKCLDKEERNSVSPFASEFKSLADLMNMDDQNPDVLLQASEKYAGNKIENDVMDEESIVTGLVPMEKLGTKSLIQSVMKSLNDQEDEAQQPKQVFERADMDKSHQESVLDNENRDSSKNLPVISGVLSSSLNRSSMNIHQETEPNYKEGYSANTSNNQHTGMDENTGMEEYSENIHQPETANNVVDSENPTLVECIDISESSRIQKSPQQQQHKSFSSNSPAYTEVPSAEANGICGNASSTISGEARNGEEICAVSGQISYSGPITYSGSTSMRSESSTTSAKSFAFPVLQAEWNSSPVKMGNANRRPLRKKRRSWKRDILCCRC